jgi:acetyl-CoA carboxylase/biotin carboxylase 1
VITDIIGRRHGLGVENLQGSGMIAGETSLANEDIFTLTLVTGRTVGIGAYLARLGQRCIQKRDSSIILTGFSALNKVLGRAVYNSNVQLGGVDIMYTNGVSHLVVDTDLQGVHEMLNWLTYVPATRNASSIAMGPVPLPVALVDPIDRPVVYRPPKEPYDPRWLLDGCMDEASGQWQHGFFDRGMDLFPLRFASSYICTSFF